MPRKYAQDPFNDLLGSDAPADDSAPDATPAPDEAEMVKEIEEHPSANWREYLQPIIRALKTQLGDVQVSLVNPELSNDYVAPQFGFNITGYVHFPNGRPDDVAAAFGDAPIRFEVHVGPPDNDIHYPIELYRGTELVNL